MPRRVLTTIWIMNKLCGVRIWRGDGNPECQVAGDCVPGCTYGCRVGCFNPARFRNPFYGRSSASEDDLYYWWRYMYTHVEWLCAECYDDMIRTARYFEEVYRDAGKFEEDPEFNKILESL
jgi:hypothetical protein